MIGYVTLGTHDLGRAAEFYDAIAKELGTGRMMENEKFIAWGSPGGAAGIGLTYPFDGKPATVGNGVMALEVVSGEGAAPAEVPAKTLDFSGHQWTASSGPIFRAGSRNYFDPANAWTDAGGALHLRISGKPGKWASAEVKLTRSLGYGTYRFRVHDVSAFETSAILTLITNKPYLGWQGHTWDPMLLGALLIGYYEGRELVYAGKVGTGFDEATLRSLHQRLSAMERDAPPFTRGLVRETGARWVRPELVAQIGFTEWTRDGKLRHPRYQGLRTDKDARDVVRETH